MEKHPFILRDLGIHKIPGFSRGLKSYEGFSSNINIIAGPNASGKSSTARAIQKLIWRSQTDGLQIDGNIDISKDSWAIRIDSNQTVVQRDGTDDELTGLPAPEDRNRYMLALHELIIANEGDLAQQIIRESIGGYDLDSAIQRLSYSSTVRNIGVSEYKNYAIADDEFKKQKDKQVGLKKEQEKLSDLYAKKHKTEEAIKFKELFDKVIQYKEAKLKFEQQKELIEGFPTILEKANGEEYKRISGLEAEIQEAETAIAEAEKTKKKYQDELEQLDIPEDGVASQELLELEERVKKISNLEEQIEDFESDKEKFETLKKEALRGIGSEVNTTEWNGLNLQDIGELDQFLESAHRTASAKRFFEKEIEELENEKNENENPKTIIQKGIDALSHWLQEYQKVSGFPTWVPVAIMVVAILSAALTFLWWLIGLIGLIIVLGLAAYGQWKSKQNPENQSAKVRKDDYGKTGLKPPEGWDIDSVKERLEELIEDLQETLWHERIEQGVKNRTGQLSDLQKQIKEVEETADDLKEKLSALPELPFDDPQNYTQLYWFIIQAKKWHDANEEVAGLKKKLIRLKENLEAELSRCSNLFQSYNADQAEDAATANAIFRNLKQQEDKRREAQKGILDCTRIISEKKGVIERKNSDLKVIYDKLKIPFGEKDEVRDLLARLDDFKEVKSEYQVNERLMSEKELAMQNHSKYAGERSWIDDLTLDESRDKYEDYEKSASNLESINGEIKEIETRVEDIKSDNTLENALKKRDEALLDLKHLYNENLSLITGQLLVDKLKSEIREQNRPHVFHQANRLFNQITKGRYEIKIDEKDDPEFIAYDTIEKVGKKLDQLSTGTRIQLLLSVRIAFVETQESSIKLPILADELLANSDDIRAKAIIDALTEISKEGRQVFYFTAQADEVAKWQSYLSGIHGIDYKIFELTGNLDEVDYHFDKQGISSISLIQNVPKADGLNYDDYGKVLNVKPYNLLLSKPTKLHLWYLLEDIELLRTCLTQGITRWGNLDSFLKYDGTIDNLDEDLLTRLKEKVDVLERFQDLYKQGRSKPIDRSVLEHSGAVSGNFIDAVSEKLDHLKGDPIKLLSSLRSSEVSGFRSNKVDELENYLIDVDYIDNKELLDKEEIQTRMQAFISNLNLTQEEASDFLKRIIEG